jgi:hypothetical protein
MRQLLQRGGWNGPAVIGTAVAVASLGIAIATWQWPQSPPGDGGMPSASPSVVTSLPDPGPSTTPSPSTTDPVPIPTQSGRYLTDLKPIAGAPYLSGGGPSGRHALVIHCASGQSNDPYREIEWNIVGSYNALSGSVAISGRIDPESPVQLQWFVGDVQVFNNSQLTLGGSRPFSAEINGGHDLKVRVTCQDSAGAATLLDAAVVR